MFRIYKNNIIDALEALASYDFQKIAWFPNNQGLMYSYNENVLDLFYDSTLEDALKNDEIVFGTEADNALRMLEKATAAIEGTDYLEEVLIDLPEMQMIREKAADALRLVNESNDIVSTVEIV